MMKKKFILEFDEEPALVFVQHSPKPADFQIWQDGKEVEGYQSIKIDADMEYTTTHEIRYATGCTDYKKLEEWQKKL